LKVISTAAVPRSAKVSYWTDINRSLFTPLGVETANSESFEANAKYEALGPTGVARIWSTPAQIRCTEEHVSKITRRRFSVNLVLNGSVIYNHYGHEIALEPNDFVLTDNTCPVRFAIPESTESMILAIPDTLLKSLIPYPEQLCGLHMSGHYGFGRTVSSMMRSIWDQIEEGVPDETGPVIAKHFLDVLVSSYALAHRQDAEGSAIANARRIRIKRFIETQLRDPELSAGAVAEEFKISPRYLRRIFAKDNESVSSYILRRRLEECAREMRSSLSRSRTITEIAFSWGFNGAPHFTRSFRDHFGMTPKEYRFRKFEAA
jgi:AraC family transcriptional activator of tynA and feaB